MFYEVLVGNIGKVWEGINHTEGMDIYNIYVRYSTLGMGRAGGEGVTLWGDGEIIEEFTGTDEPMIKLTNIEGISRLSGTDDHGADWIQFEVDYFAEQMDGECAICGETLASGWLCLDGGEEVCSSHIEYITA